MSSLRLAQLLLALAVSPLFASGSNNAKSAGDRQIEAIAKIDFGNVYYDDGAADGTITEKGELIGSGPNFKPHPTVKALVDLRNNAIPLLIEHLDDTRPTRAYFKGKPVPLGHVALDILTHIIEMNRGIFVIDCADDGLGACIQAGYYFRPDASLQEMKDVKEKWRKPYRGGAIRFAYPKWWR